MEIQLARQKEMLTAILMTTPRETLTVGQKAPQTAAQMVIPRAIQMAAQMVIPRAIQTATKTGHQMVIQTAC